MTNKLSKKQILLALNQVDDNMSELLLDVDFATLRNRQAFQELTDEFNMSVKDLNAEVDMSLLREITLCRDMFVDLNRLRENAIEAIESLRDIID